MSTLDTIIAHKHVELAAARAAVAETELRRQAADMAPARDFRGALHADGHRINAEVKKTSPPQGVIRPDFDPVAIAHQYVAAGAAALSVLTDARFFQGSAEIFRAVRADVQLPMLRKDFTVDAYQLYEARVLGADAVLLIVAALAQPQLGDLLALSAELGMASLVEVHNAEELDRALAAGAQIVGINNRDLHTFVTDTAVTLRLAPAVPRTCTLVSESGIKRPEDLAPLAAAGVDAFLIGETFMRAPSPGALLQTFVR